MRDDLIRWARALLLAAVVLAIAFGGAYLFVFALLVLGRAGVD